jgi:DNA-binding NarL/FixJ family response regulator
LASRILVVDDHHVTRQGVRTLIGIQAGWVVCGEASDGDEAIAKASELQPDLILMDLAMPRMNGLDATRRILQSSPEMKVLILSMLDTAESVRAARESGARGYVTKSAKAGALVKAVAALLQGDTSFPA